MVLIILITLVAVGARIIGLSYDDLNSYNHDERIHLFTAEQIYQGNLNPREIWEGRKFLYIFYPWLSMYIVAGVYHLYDLLRTGSAVLAYWLIYLSGEGGSYLKDYFRPPPELDGRQALYLGRLTVALIGAANIPLLYLVGKKLFNRRVGLLSAAILALSGYHIANCHWMKNDIIAAFFLTAAFFFAVRIYLRGKILDYLLAAVFSAVAINTKHYNAPILAVGIFAHLLAIPRLTFRGLSRRLLAGKFLLFILVFLLFLAATYPLLYLETDYIVSSFEEMRARTETHAMFGSLGTQARPRTFFQIRRDNLINFARFSWGMVAGMGPYVVLLGLGGMAAALWSREKRFLLAASFPLVYIPAAVLVASPGVRYQDVIPLNPFFALLAACFVYFIFRAAFGKKRLLAAAAFTAAGIVLLVPYSRMAVSLNYGYWERSARYFGSRWAARHIPPGSSVLCESKTIWLDDSQYQTARVRALWNNNVAALAEAGVVYLVTSSRYEGRALEESGLFGPDHPYGQFYLTLPSRYDLVKEFDLGEIPYRGGTSKIWELRREYPLAPRGINSALLRRLQHNLSFSSSELFLPDSEGRLAGTTAFIVPSHEQVGRLLISSIPIPRMGIQVVNGPEAGRIRIRHGREKITADFAGGQTRMFVLPPRPGFPFIHYSYRISVASPWNSPCLVRVLTDPYRIGLGYYEIGEYAEAIGWLEKVCRTNPDDWYPRVLLASAWNREGSEEKATYYRSEAERIFPGYRAALKTLVNDELAGESWSKEFENWTGFRPDWLAERAGRRWYGDQWLETILPNGVRRLEIERFHLPPGDYLIRLAGDPLGDGGPISVRLRRGPEVIRNWDLSGVDDGTEMTFENRGLAGEYSLLVEEKGSVISEILVHPGTGSVRSRVRGYLRDLEFEEEGN